MEATSHGWAWRLGAGHLHRLPYDVFHEPKEEHQILKTVYLRGSSRPERDRSPSGQGVTQGHRDRELRVLEKQESMTACFDCLQTQRWCIVRRRLRAHELLSLPLRIDPATLAADAHALVRHVFQDTAQALKEFEAVGAEECHLHYKPMQANLHVLQPVDVRTCVQA